MMREAMVLGRFVWKKHGERRRRRPSWGGFRSHLILKLRRYAEVLLLPVRIAIVAHERETAVPLEGRNGQKQSERRIEGEKRIWSSGSSRGSVEKWKTGTS